MSDPLPDVPTLTTEQAYWLREALGKALSSEPTGGAHTVSVPTRWRDGSITWVHVDTRDRESFKAERDL